MAFKGTRRVFLGALLAGAASGCASTIPTGDSGVEVSEYRLGPGDQIGLILTGDVEGVDPGTAQAQIYTALGVLVPLAMAFAVLVLGNRVNRWANGVLGVLSAFTLLNLVLQNLSDPLVVLLAAMFLAALLTEVVMTMMFVVIILGATDRRAPQGFAPIAIGLGLTLIHLISIPVTNTSVNPARSTGQALFVGGWAVQQLWLFWVAPLVGGALAGLMYHAVFEEREAAKPREKKVPAAA